MVLVEGLNSGGMNRSGIVSCIFGRNQPKRTRAYDNKLRTFSIVYSIKSSLESVKLDSSAVCTESYYSYVYTEEPWTVPS